MSDAGKSYGLELHYGKLQLLNVQCSSRLRQQDGDTLEPSPEMTYLGTILSADGRIDAELSRRIGTARGELRAPCKVWNQSCLGRKRKLHLYQALDESKLLYSLSTCCFNVAQTRRIHGLQAKAVRQILGIQPAYLSRISNAEVLRRAGILTASEVLAKQQLDQLGMVLRADVESPLHTAAFTPGTMEAATSHFVRRVVRPRKEWIPTVCKKAQYRTGNVNLYALAADEKTWKRSITNDGEIDIILDMFVVVCLRCIER